MRSTRSASQNTPPPKIAAKGTQSEAVTRTEKQDTEPVDEPTSEHVEVMPVSDEIKQEQSSMMNGEFNAHEVGDMLADRTGTYKEATEESKLESVTESGVVHIDSPTKEHEMMDNAREHNTETPVELDVEEEEEEMVDEEIEDDVEEVEVEENEEYLEGYNEEEEVEEVEEVYEVGEDIDEIEEEDHEAEPEVEAELFKQRPVSERQKRKKFEVFVGGLDKDATEDDVRKAFEAVGEVVEIRLMRHPQTGKNKGYAFVRFATVQQAKKAATELERTKIRDKECGVVPSEDNDTLFVGNICKSWKKDQVFEKLKQYGVEGVEEITLMPDSKNEELNRGYAFLELATHNDAVKAFVRLSKPDAIFGSDRSAKVAWAEPLLDEDVLAKVKSVFVDGVPSTWDESKVKEHFGKYGDIERIVLAKDNPKSKRTDYAFVNFTARESALACVEALKDGELADGDSKIKVKVAFSKPVPRKKHIKGSRGGYPVGGRPSGRGRGWTPAVRGSFASGRGRGGRGFSRGGRIPRVGGRRPYDEPRFNRGPKKHMIDDRQRMRPPPRGVVPHRVSRGMPRGSFSRREDMSSVRRPSYDYNPSRGRGFSSRRGRGAPFRDDYGPPRSANLSPGFGRARNYSSRPVAREDMYLRRSDRGHSYERDMDGRYGTSVSGYPESVPGMKRPYAAMEEGAAYYDSSRRGYPRPRVDYVDPDPVGAPHYSESVRPPPLGRSSLGGRNAIPPVGTGSVPQASLQIYDQPGSSSMYVSGGPGYPPVLPGGSDYPPAAGELRGGSYNSSMYGGRPGSGYGLPGGGSGSYY